MARRRGGRWNAVLIQGPSGAGKSDLALRALAAGWRLVADDRCLAWTSGGRLYVRAPETLAGLIEARGLGVLPHPYLAFAPVALAVRIEDLGALERVPEPEFLDVLGILLPQVRFSALEGSATAKLGLAFAREAGRLGLT